VVDPDVVCAKGLEGVASPDVLWVEFGDVNVSVRESAWDESCVVIVTYWMMMFLVPLDIRLQ
jgi:hypothetical protein